MNFGLVSKSPRLVAEFATLGIGVNVGMSALANAFTAQLCSQVCPAYGLAPINVAAYATEADAPAGTILQLYVDDLDDPQAAAYHVINGGVASSLVGVDVTINNGGTVFSGPNSLSVSGSHEIVEIIGDAATDAWVDTAKPGVEKARELCDQVEGDDGNTVVVDCHGVATTVTVTNFLLPAGLDPTSKGPFDLLSTLKSCDEIRPEGYAIVRTTTGETQSTARQYGSNYPAWKKKLKAKAINRSSRRCTVK